MTALSKVFGLHSWQFRFGGMATDRVVWALLIGLVALSIIDALQAFRSIGFTVNALVGMAPFFLLAIAVAGYANATGADKLIARAFSGNLVRAVVSAALVGALSPFCSCGVIPLIAAMLGAGVPLAPVMAFWVASPIMDPEMFILTAAGIGLNFTIAKTVATVAMGLMAGFAVIGLQRLGLLGNVLSQAQASRCRPSFDPSSPVYVAWRFWAEPSRIKIFGDEVRKTGWFLFKWLTLAFFLESLMIAYVPVGWIAEIVGGDKWFGILLASVIGIPSYLNGYAAIPLVAGLLDMGMSPGAAMAFVTSGAVSSIPAAIAVYALVRKPVFVIYVLLGLAGSMMSGYAYQLSGGAI
ncbi:MAG: permease [Gammaproteobacteria bacterium]